MNRIKLESSSSSTLVNLGDPLPLPYKIVNNPKSHHHHNERSSSKDSSFTESDNDKIRRIYTSHKRNEFNIPISSPNIPTQDLETNAHSQPQSHPSSNSSSNSQRDLEVAVEDEDDTTAVDNKRINQHILKTRNFKSYPANDRISFGNRSFYQQSQPQPQSQSQSIQRVNNLINQLNELIKYNNDKQQLIQIKSEINKLISIIDDQEQLELERQQLEQEHLIEQQETNIFEELDKLQQQQAKHEPDQNTTSSKTQSTIIVLLSLVVLVLVFLLGSYLLADLNYDYCYFSC